MDTNFVSERTFVGQVISSQIRRVVAVRRHGG